MDGTRDEIDSESVRGIYFNDSEKERNNEFDEGFDGVFTKVANICQTNKTHDVYGAKTISDPPLPHDFITLNMEK